MQSYKRIERRCLPDEVGSKEDFFFNETKVKCLAQCVTHIHILSINNNYTSIKICADILRIGET